MSEEIVGKHKIYCFNNGGPERFLNAVAIADDGHVLAQHLCSHECFMRHDLGISSNWKHENYNNHFGEDNWQLEWVSDVENHEGLKSAFELNAQMVENSSEEAAQR